MRVIKSAVKDEIRLLEKEGRLEEAFNKIRMLRMTCDKYDCLEDELFVNYCLAWHYSRNENTKDLCKYYLKLNNDIFDIEQNKKDREYEYYKWLWLNTEVYKDEITKDEYCRIFMTIHSYYYKIGDKRFYNGAIQNIVFRSGNDEEIIEFMREIIEEFGNGHQLVKDMVSDCKKLKGDHVYIRVQELLNLCLNGKDII